MYKIALLLKMFLRNKARYGFVAFTIILVLASILGGMAASSASSSYIAVKLSEKIPVHIVMSYAASLYIEDVGRNGVGLALDFIDNATDIHGLIENLPSGRVDAVSTLISVKIGLYPGKRGAHVSMYINSTDNRWGSTIEDVFEAAATVGARSRRIRVVAGEMGKGDGVSLMDIRGNISVEETPGTRYIVSYRIAEDNRTLAQGVLAQGPVGYVFLIQNPLSNISSATLIPIPTDSASYYIRPDIVTGLDSLREILRRVEGIGDVDASIYITVVHDIVLDPRILPLSSIDAARTVIHDVMDEIASTVSEKHGDIIHLEKQQGFFIVPERYSGAINASWTSGEEPVNLYSPLADILATISLVTTLQSTVTIAGLSLPVMVAAWYLLTIISSLIADWGRRSIALLVTRGESLKSAYRYFLLSIIVAALIGAAAALPFAWATGDLLVSQMFPGLRLGPETVFNAPVAVAAALFSALLAYFAVNRVKKIFSELGESLSQLTQIYIPPIREEWRPGTFMKLLFILSIFKYTLWALGLTATDLIAYASRIHFILVVLVIIYIPIDFFMTLLAPFVATYFITMYITHSEKILDTISRAIGGLVSGELSFTVKSFIMRGSTRLYRISFVIALIIAVALDYMGTATSLEAWYPRMQEWIEQRGRGDPMFFILQLTAKANVAAYRAIAYYSVLIAVLSSIMLTLILVRDMDRELAALRARGAGPRHIIRFVYGVVFTVIAISSVIGAVSGLIWMRGGLRGMSQGFFMAPAADMPRPDMVFTPLDAAYAALILASMFTAPLIVLYMDTRRPVAEKLRVV